MAERQARIFVPNIDPHDGWAETLLGRVIGPLVKEHESTLEWFWFSRYEVPRGIDDGDCEISQLPADYLRDVQQHKNVHRSVRFRYCVADESAATFESEFLDQVSRHGYFVPGGPLAWDLNKGLGDDRHIGKEKKGDALRQERAALVVQHHMSTCRLVLHALVGPDKNGRYCLESNSHMENPHGSTFESVHHLFCNITDVPTTVLIQMGTHWSGLQPTECRIKY